MDVAAPETGAVLTTIALPSKLDVSRAERDAYSASGGDHPTLARLQPEFMDIKNLHEVPAFTTKDGSEIRELLAHRNSAIRHQSLAEARVPVGTSTLEHYHVKTEEIYYITAGTGQIRIEGELHAIMPGDAIAIPPGKKHKLWNNGTEVLTLLCCCAPAYEHDDTIITEK